MNYLIYILLFSMLGSNTLLKKVRKNYLVRQRFNFFHKYHILSSSPWPLFSAVSILQIALGLVIYFHFNRPFILILALVQLFVILDCWFSDILIESLDHTDEIRKGIKIGMLLFILSEIMFFFSFFWAFFYLSLSPSVELGCSWPPVGLLNLVIPAFNIPLLNTLILLCSGIVLTYSHYILDFSILELKKKLYKLSLFLSLKKFKNFKLIILLDYILFMYIDNKFRVAISLCFTILLALSFSSLQGYEYFNSKFFLSDGVYGSTFFMMTGFHGFHVLIGTLLLLTCYHKLLLGHFDDSYYTGFECAIWYWHFVDVVWVFLYIFVYIWGSIPRIGGFVIIKTNRHKGRFLIFDYLWFDFASNFQLEFQDPATKIMAQLIQMHNYLMFYLFLIFFFVFWVFFNCILISKKKFSIIYINNSKFIKDKNQFKVFFKLVPVYNTQVFDKDSFIHE